MSNWIETQYLHLLEDILEQGVKKTDRTGTGTINVFGRQIRHNMKDGFPLLTTKKMAFKTMVTELLWFLRGDTNIKYLVDNGCHIWDGDAYKFFKNSFPIKKSNPPKDYINEDGKLLTQEEFINKIKTDDEFAKKWGELGPIYGKQWRSWKGNGVPLTKDYEGNVSSHLVKQIDQIANSINLLKTDPDSRRNRVNAWNVGELDQMVLPPCHTDFQFFTRELSFDEKVDYARSLYGKEDWWNINDSRVIEILQSDKRAISLMFNMRSNDVPLGLPFNIASYALLLEIIGKIVNMVPDELIGNLGDCHIYLNQIEGVKEQICREPLELPTLKLPKTDAFWNGFDVSLFGHLEPSDFQIEGYKSHPSIKIPLSN
jgi:thymidylate synthase